MTPRTFGDDWWTPPRRNGGLALGLSLLGATVSLTAVAALIGFLVAGSAVSEGQEVLAVTLGLAISTLAVFSIMTVTTGLAATLLLWATRRRSVLAFAAAGAMAGLPLGAIIPALSGEDVSIEVLGFMTLGGALHLVLARWLLGVRAPKAEAPAGSSAEDGAQ